PTMIRSCLLFKSSESGSRACLRAARRPKPSTIFPVAIGQRRRAPAWLGGLTACSRPRVQYDGFGPFLAHWGGDPFLHLKAGPPPRRSGFSFCARGTPAPRPRCFGGDARRLDSPLAPVY